MTSLQEVAETPLEHRTDHTVKAVLNLSGERFHIGIYTHPEGDSIFLKTLENAEPIYFTFVEADLLIAALMACINEIKEF